MIYFLESQTCVNTARFLLISLSKTLSKTDCIEKIKIILYTVDRLKKTRARSVITFLAH